MTKEQIIRKIVADLPSSENLKEINGTEWYGWFEECWDKAINFIPCCTEFKCGEERVFNEEKCSEQCSQCKKDYSEDI